MTGLPCIACGRTDPCPDCRHIGYESSPYGPDGDWGPES